ncbi:MAG: flagellar hook-associated protein 3 [Armatimonadetes bacterium 55-13]|nr:flagellar hook-associated protein FlgL [Armatimonadota bacterium]OJU64303.1 MAG: flagellar hook-associated protein 3 [Armatimonadetes bacterium 55-13]
MRISTAYQFDTYTNDMRLAQERLAAAGRQVSTGKRITAPSDDPLGTSQSLTMRSYKSATEQYQKNLLTGKGYLGYTEDALANIYDSVKKAYTLAVSGANDTADQSARDAMAAEIGTIQERIVQLANTRGPSGQYIFGGQQNGTAAYTLSGSSLTYNGDSNPINVEVGPSEMMKANTQSEPVLSDLYTKLETLKNNLLGGNAGAISGVSINEMQDAMKSVSALRSDVGARLQKIEDYQTQYTRRVDDLTEGISDIEEVDISQAIMKYQLAQTAYQGALSIASKGFGLSLMDFIQG